MIELIIAPSSFRLSGDGRNSSHQVFSEIYFQLDGKFFPEKSWDDFVVVILNWWIGNILSIVNQKDGEVRCDFMDGPFFFKVSMFGVYFSICFVDNRSDNNKVVFQDKIHALDFMRILRKAANLVLRLAAEIKISHHDLTELKKNHKRIQCAINDYSTMAIQINAQENNPATAKQ